MNREYSRAIRTILLAGDWFGNELVIKSYDQLDMRKSLLGMGCSLLGKGFLYSKRDT